MAVKAIPDGCDHLIPHLICKGAGKAFDFYKKAFGAEELFRVPGPDGAVMHGEMKIGKSTVYLADEFPQMGCVSPQSLNGSPVTVHMYVQDVDKAFKKATDAGATAAMPPTDMFWGDRYAKVTDPFGHQWSIATHKEDVPPEELGKRAAEAMGGQCG